MKIINLFKNTDYSITESMQLIPRLLKTLYLKDKIKIIKSSKDKIYPLNKCLIIQIRNVPEDLFTEWVYCILITSWVLGYKNLDVESSNHYESPKDSHVFRYLCNALLPTNKLLNHDHVKKELLLNDLNLEPIQEIIINDYQAVADDFSVPIGAVYYKQQMIESRI